jgi:uncharacterized protein YbbC (DUF1343 family)
MANVILGVENLADNPLTWLKGKRLGLLGNPASTGRDFQPSRNLIQDLYSKQLVALFSPQHGFFAEKQDNMIESDDCLDPVLKIPVYSLYGGTRKPTPRMFENMDVLLVDIQDVGTRVYTFIYTLSYCMEAARDMNKQVVVLDRPNPINGLHMEGHCLAADCTSFVGRYPIPMRHGMTIGEMALLFNDYFKIGCHLEVIPMTGWQRYMYYPDTGLPWIPPSPNLPTFTSALVYPGQVLWEGTNISEGRGTTQPFEVWGAPFLDTDKVLKAIGGPQQPGAYLRTLVFEPTAHKWRAEACRGFQIHVTNPLQFKPWHLSLKLLQKVIRHHQDHFKWKSPPYEYEFHQRPIDLIFGNKELLQRIENGEPLDMLEHTWKGDLHNFEEIRKPYLLYP